MRFNFPKFLQLSITTLSITGARIHFLIIKLVKHVCFCDFFFWFDTYLQNETLFIYTFKKAFLFNKHSNSVLNRLLRGHEFQFIRDFIDKRRKTKLSIEKQPW